MKVPEELIVPEAHVPEGLNVPKAQIPEGFKMLGASDSSSQEQYSIKLNMSLGLKLLGSMCYNYFKEYLMKRRVQKITQYTHASA
jgi:hypothetical protein